MCGKTCRPTNRIQLSLPCVSIQVIDSPWSCDAERPCFNMESQHGQIWIMICVSIYLSFFYSGPCQFLGGYSIEIQIAYDVYIYIYDDHI